MNTKNSTNNTIYSDNQKNEKIIEFNVQIIFSQV